MKRKKFGGEWGKKRKSNYCSGDYESRNQPKANLSTRKRASGKTQNSEEPQEPAEKSRKTDSQKHGKGKQSASGKYKQGERTSKSTASDDNPQNRKWQNNEDNLLTWRGLCRRLGVRVHNTCPLDNLVYKFFRVSTEQLDINTTLRHNPKIEMMPVFQRYIDIGSNWRMDKSESIVVNPVWKI